MKSGVFAFLAAIALLAGCGSKTDKTTGAGAPGGPVTPPYNLRELMAKADEQQGRVLFMACAGCHTLQAGGPSPFGPNLHGVFGQRAGTRGGFNYSDAMRAATVVWSPETLDRWLANPRDLPGTRMNFNAIHTPQERADLLAYLVQETGAGP